MSYSNKKPKTERMTLEKELDQFRRDMPLMSIQGLKNRLRQYQSYNSGLGCYNEIIQEIKDEITNR